MTELSTQKAVAIAELNPIITDIAAFEGTVESIDIVDEDTQANMADLVKLMQSRRRKLEDKRTSLVKPLNDVVGEINKLFKGPRDTIDKIVTIAKKKMSRFAEAQLAIERERKRQEEEAARKEREEAERLKEALNVTGSEEATAVVDQVVEDAQAKVEKAEKKVAKPKTVRGDASSVVVSKTWKAEVVDLAELVKGVHEGRLPLSCLEPNMAQLQALSRETKKERTVDGVRYYEHVSTSVR